MLKNCLKFVIFLANWIKNKNTLGPLLPSRKKGGVDKAKNELIKKWLKVIKVAKSDLDQMVIKVTTSWWRLKRLSSNSISCLREKQNIESEIYSGICYNSH